MHALLSPNETQKVHAIIAEDEQPLAMALQKEISDLWPELTIVEVFSDGKSAQKTLTEQHIDIAFLDISMPYKTGVELAEYCAIQKIETLIVLVTAYPDHALDAFKFNVCDYLLKPLCKTRLSETITRLKERLSNRPQSVKTKILQYLPVQKGNQSMLLNVNDICCFVSEQKYVKVVSVDNTFLISKTLLELEQELDSSQFWRVHRNSIVNVNKIQHCQKTLTGRLALTLFNHDERLTVSRPHLHRFKTL